MGFLVNSSVCKIPAIEPWHPSVLPLVKKMKPLINCNEEAPQWTYVNKTVIDFKLNFAIGCTVPSNSVSYFLSNFNIRCTA